MWVCGRSTSVLNAEFMANEVPGVRVPDPVLERMRRVNACPEAARAEGVAIAREVGAALQERLSRVCTWPHRQDTCRISGGGAGWTQVGSKKALSVSQCRPKFLDNWASRPGICCIVPGADAVA